MPNQVARVVLGQVSRVEADTFFRYATGGQAPDFGDSIVYTEEGWQFRPRIEGRAAVTAATGPVGNVIAKAELFDSEGVSVGFIPIYDAIT